MPWTEKTPLPSVSSYTVAAPGSSYWLYAITGGGGTVAEPPLVYGYNGAGWSLVASPISNLPGYGGGFAMTSGARGLHLLGGYSAGGGDPMKTHQIFNEAANAWSLAPQMLTGRAGHAVVTGNDGRIFAMGGVLQDFKFLASVEAFDPLTKTWTTLQAMNVPRSSLAAVTAPDGRIWAIGGTGSKDGYTTQLFEVEIFDPTAGSAGDWSFGPPLQGPLSNLAAAVGPDGRIYVMGGLDFNGVAKNTLFSLNPSNPSPVWHPEEPMATAQSYFGAATGPDGLIYAIGGGFNPDVEAFQVVLPAHPPEQVVSLDGQYQVHELSTADGTYWNDNNLCVIAGAPAAVGGSSLSGYELTAGKSKQVAYLDAAGNVHELWVVPGREWNHANLTMRTGAPAAYPGSTLCGYQWTIRNSKQVAYLGIDGNVSELYVVQGSDWGYANLSMNTGYPPPSPGDPSQFLGPSICGYEWDAGASKQVAYLDEAGDLHELWVVAGGDWQHFPLTASTTGALSAAGSLSGYQWKKGQSKQVAYLDTAGNVHELWVVVGGGWEHVNLTARTGAPPAASGSALVGYEWSAGNSKQVVYLDTAGHVWELYVIQGSDWQHADLTLRTGAPPAADGSSLTAYEWAIDKSKQVMYLDDAGHVHQLRIITGGDWVHRDLTATTPGAAAALWGSSLSGYQWLSV